MIEFTKKEKKKLSELADLAYQREMESLLMNLADKFDQFRSKEISCFELNELIHKYHDGDARDIYKLYSLKDGDLFFVGRAVSMGILKIDEIPESLKDSILQAVQFFKS